MDNYETLQKFYDARARLALDEHLSYVHPDCLFRISGSKELGAFTQTWSTPDEIRAAATGLFDKWDLSGLDEISSNICGDTIFVHRCGTVGYRPDGTSMETEVMDKLTFKDGLIIEYLQFVDTYAVAHFVAQKNMQAF